MFILKMHELIDKKHPKCLYCDSDCEIEHKSEWITPPPLGSTSLYISIYDRDIITCSFCKEKFEIHERQAANGNIEQEGFGFTCKNYFVFFNYVENYFDLYKSDDEHKYITTIPSFKVDFSDKNNLCEKFKVYVIFS